MEAVVEVEHSGIQETGYNGTQIFDFSKILCSDYQVSPTTSRPTWNARFGDLKKHRPSLQISNFEASKINTVDIVFGFT
jgi:hypothetical protein